MDSSLFNMRQIRRRAGFSESTKYNLGRDFPIAWKIKSRAKSSLGIPKTGFILALRFLFCVKIITPGVAKDSDAGRDFPFGWNFVFGRIRPLCACRKRNGMGHLYAIPIIDYRLSSEKSDIYMVQLFCCVRDLGFASFPSAAWRTNQRFPKKPLIKTARRDVNCIFEKVKRIFPFDRLLLPWFTSLRMKPCPFER